ncbi:MAG: ABC transporter permease [Bacteroidales bacterium]|nr:ABC transporter permease [Bacteroidales bacterium]
MNYLITSVEQALFSLRGNKVRTSLSLLGMSIGIFSIVTVLSVVDSLKQSLNQGFESFGSDMVFVRQFPMEEEDGGEVKWWKYLKRPPVSMEDYIFLKENGNHFGTISFAANTPKDVTSAGHIAKEVSLVGFAGDWKHLTGCEVEYGRGFTESETGYRQSNHHFQNVALIGRCLCDRLFPGIDIKTVHGRTVRIGNVSMDIVGVMEENGESMVKIFDSDNTLFLPAATLGRIVPIESTATLIAATPAEGISKEELISEIVGMLRVARRLRPSEKEDFSIGELSFVANEVDKIISRINLAGILIGGFSLLVGAFGIANIMFVSVKERTRQIGICMALGAKRSVILSQFLMEAAVLSAMGGLLGVFLVWLLTLAFPDEGYFVLRLSLFRAATGILIAAITGLAAGLAPALSASKMNPVDAINSL